MRTKYFILFFFLLLTCLQACTKKPFKGFDRSYVPHISPAPSFFKTKIESTKQEEWKDDLEVKSFSAFKTFDMVSETEKLKKQIKSHDEKEKYENFESRMNFCKTLDNKAISFAFSKQKYNRSIEFNYDPELQETTISIRSLPFNQTSKKGSKESKCNANGYFVLTKAKSSGSYIGSNSFGAKKQVTNVVSMTYMLAPLNNSFDNGINRDFAKFKFKISPSEAKSLDDNLIIIASGHTVCNQCSGKIIDFSLVPFSPTMEFPVDGAGFVFGLYYSLEKIIIADQNKKKVYLSREFLQNN